MAQQGPNPIEVYEAAAKLLIPTIAGIDEGQLGGSTPCSEWNVRGLINHNIKVQAFANSVLGGAPMDPATMFSVDHALPEEGAEAAIKAGTDLVLATLQKLDLSQVITTPFGDMPAGHFAMVPMADMVIHRWDLAKGTNQNTNFESNMAEVCIQVLTPALDMGRASGFFGSEVSVPDSASVQDRLLGMSGRTP